MHLAASMRRAVGTSTPTPPIAPFVPHRRSWADTCSIRRPAHPNFCSGGERLFLRSLRYGRADSPSKVCRERASA